MRKLGRAVSAVCGVVSQALHGAAEGGGEEGAGGADEEEISHNQPQRQASAFFLRHSRWGTGVLSHAFALVSSNPLPPASDLSLRSGTFRSLNTASSLCSDCECEHWAAGAAAHPPAGATQDQTDPHRAPRHGRTTLLEGQQ